jgi:hypothetical protein
MHPQVQRLLDTQPAGVGGAIQGSSGGIDFGVDPLLDLAGTQDGRERLGLAGVSDEGNLFGRSLEDVGVERSQGTSDLVELAPGHSPFDEVKLEGPDLLAVESVERAVEVLAELNQRQEVDPRGARRVVE